MQVEAMEKQISICLPSIHVAYSPVFAMSDARGEDVKTAELQRIFWIALLATVAMW
ncbi:MAG: hypothetical protein ACM359_00970 [Bacillota bacterium]